MEIPEVKLFCTAGRGTEPFVEKEIKEKFNAKVQISKILDGKVFFSVNQLHHDVKTLTNLKTIERIFLELNCFKTSRLPHGKGTGQFLNALKRRLIKSEKFLKTAEILQSLNVGKSDEPVRKKQKTSDFRGPSFRVSCKVSGKFIKLVTPQKLSIEIGKTVSQTTGWLIDLKNPTYEVNVHINDEMVVAGIPITSEPVSKRKYILNHGLRSPVAWIMAHLADIQPNEVVLDPMCGKSTILIEAAKSLQPEGIYIGIDKNQTHLEKAYNNLQFAGLQGKIHLIQADGLGLPLNSESIDKIICDAPFDQKHRVTDCHIVHFYSQLLSECYRVLKTGGKMVLLTSSKLRSSVIKLLHSDTTHTFKDKIIDKTLIEVNDTMAETVSKLCHCDKDSKYGRDEIFCSARDNVMWDTSSNELNLYKKPKCELSDIKNKDALDDSERESSLSVSISNLEGEITNNESNLKFLEDHYIKLGETHAYIIVAEK